LCSCLAGEQQLNFCSGNDVELRFCISPWTLLSALDTLIRGLNGQLVQENCLKYQPVDNSRAAKKLCTKECNLLPQQLQALGGGNLKRIQVVDAADMQMYIRRTGAVVTRIDIYEDFKGFFEASPRGVYPGPNAEAAKKAPVSHKAFAACLPGQDPWAWYDRDTLSQSMHKSGVLLTEFGGGSIAVRNQGISGLSWLGFGC
jgi:hypothetical protein